MGERPFNDIPGEQLRRRDGQDATSTGAAAPFPGGRELELLSNEKISTNIKDETPTASPREGRVGRKRRLKRSPRVELQITPNGPYQNEQMTTTYSTSISQSQSTAIRPTLSSSFAPPQNVPEDRRGEKHTEQQSALGLPVAQPRPAAREE
ncbi:unnamed protein product [Calypogeia fissa]